MPIFDPAQNMADASTNMTAEISAAKTKLSNILGQIMTDLKVLTEPAETKTGAEQLAAIQAATQQATTYRAGGNAALGGQQRPREERRRGNQGDSPQPAPAPTNPNPQTRKSFWERAREGTNRAF